MIKTNLAGNRHQQKQYHLIKSIILLSDVNSVDSCYILDFVPDSVCSKEKDKAVSPHYHQGSNSCPHSLMFDAESICEGLMCALNGCRSANPKEVLPHSYLVQTFDLFWPLFFFLFRFCSFLYLYNKQV